MCHRGKIININPITSNYERIAKMTIRMMAGAALKAIEDILMDTEKEQIPYE